MTTLAQRQKKKLGLYQNGIIFVVQMYTKNPIKFYKSRKYTDKLAY